jgi:integrase
MPVKRLDRRCIKVLRDRKGERIEAGNNRLKAIRQVFAWALEDEMEGVTDNPAKDVKYLSSGSKGFHTWTPDELSQFEGHHPLGTKAHLALALLMYTGVRRSDVVLLGRQLIRDGWLKFTPFKGRKRNPVTIDIPVSPELQRVIDASPCGDLTFLVTERGVPFCKEGFGNKFRGWCNQAGLPKRCAAHGVRKAGAVRAAENGATPHQLMATFGWLDASMAELYTKEANRKRLSAGATELLRRSETGTKVPHRGGQ